MTSAIGSALAATFLIVGPAAAQDQVAPAVIPAAELASRINEGAAPFVLDVRTSGEYAEGRIAGAVNIPHTELADRLAELDFDASEEIVVYCQAGPRAKHAAATLAEAGFSSVRDLEGHMRGWQEAELPVEKPDTGSSYSEKDGEASDSEGEDQ